ncbi:MoaD/ThiS family protein [Chitinophagaceae bacterium LB-8]|uniref:MoaD/ThiS family protein n=1 Tax=Paraflavisolibacter caeni TaxID=2982496 RepID=A0A9X3BI63_9BACT|nr:MoaD/ThiS family protein [Paraflavisolibacter caeni]MCU7550777.1 MoaD/ThiS family protein [Paraflavisolibacter caeni]
MKVQVFAGLKEYFEPTFELEKDVQSIDGLKRQLIRLRPSSAALLESCRFAVNDDFVDVDYELNEGDTIVILPPSSGG